MNSFMKVSFLVWCSRNPIHTWFLGPFPPDKEPPPVLIEPSNMFTEQEDGPITTQSAAPFASVFTLWRTGNSYWTIYRILPGYPLNLSVLTGIMLIDKDHHQRLLFRNFWPSPYRLKWLLMEELIDGVPQQSLLCSIHASVLNGSFVIQQMFVCTQMHSLFPHSFIVSTSFLFLFIPQIARTTLPL